MVAANKLYQAFQNGGHPDDGEIKRKYDRSWCRRCYKAYTMALDTWLARPHDGGSPATTQYMGSERLSDDFAECARPATAAIRATRR